jgi:hypothetical protein
VGYTTFTALLHDKFLRPTGPGKRIQQDGQYALAYNPVNVVVVREVDAARTVGRKRLRTKNKTG